MKKSQDAAVGALVQMFRKAPPLRQDNSNSVKFSQACRPEIWSNSSQEPHQPSKGQASIQRDDSSSVISSGHVTSKTTTVALEELQSYREMKNLLLGQAAGLQFTEHGFPTPELSHFRGNSYGKDVRMWIGPKNVILRPVGGSNAST
ncbi:unnamed protein product [Prunus armeniaca]|uniref:Uncharacterized protein n=1 Tax=Prunus armeniaca TaxID=36596 RepID=A0A6J5XJE4_PRUAR|nr:unnamed protein product [Prunus armeniaca]CAB4314066.1 unnamed protein product [Prunus armeniaca]